MTATTDRLENGGGDSKAGSQLFARSPGRFAPQTQARNSLGNPCRFAGRSFEDTQLPKALTSHGTELLQVQTDFWLGLEVEERNWSPRRTCKAGRIPSQPGTKAGHVVFCLGEYYKFFPVTEPTLAQATLPVGSRLCRPDGNFGSRSMNTLGGWQYQTRNRALDCIARPRLVLPHSLRMEKRFQHPNFKTRSPFCLQHPRTVFFTGLSSCPNLAQHKMMDKSPIMPEAADPQFGAAVSRQWRARGRRVRTQVFVHHLPSERGLEATVPGFSETLMEAQHV